MRKLFFLIFFLCFFAHTLIMAETFTNDKYKISFTISDAWEKAPKVPQQIIALYVTKDSLMLENQFIPNVSMTVDEASAEKLSKCEDFTKQMVETLKKNGYEVKSTGKEDKVKKLDVFSNTFTRQVKSVSEDSKDEKLELVLKQKQYYILHNKKYYIVTYSGKENDFEKHEPQILELLNSITFK
ncbi:MAG: hypothetical protein ABIA04_01675 [Pseudomonadota bacterium]